MMNQTKHIVLLLFLLLLASCSTQLKKQDGPPSFYVNEAAIPNAVPKPEKLSRYGNMRSYVVFGRRYHVMRSPKHYEEVGIASWYGTKFHARRTSNGERYNMLAMTAAHKTLPLPTYVEVTNLKNRRKVIVKVNDRGPFAPKRIIDLSYVAAKKLGMLGHGTTLVRVKAIDPYSFNRPRFFAKKKDLTHRLLAQKRSSDVYLQVGAFRNKANAERLKQRLTVCLHTPVNIAHPSSDTQLYRVKVGPIKDMATADNITRQLKNLGISSNRI